MAGRLPPETEYPVPVTEFDLMVTAAVPLEVTVTDFVTAVPTDTLPNASEVALRLRAGTDAFSCIAKFCEEELRLAATEAACELVTEATFAVNDAVDRPEATATVAGTVTALLLLATLTLTPPDGAAELSDTVQGVVPAPVNELLPHERAFTVGVSGEPDPLRVIETLFEFDPWIAVSVTVCDDATVEEFAPKFALAAPEGTDTEAGTVNALLLLARLTEMPALGAAALNVTVQVFVPAPIMDELAQLRPERDGEEEPAPLPCSLTAPATLSAVLVLPSTLSWPVESVAEPGS